jgi:phenylalanine-4-hydroxylase
MAKRSKYRAMRADQNGLISYSDEAHGTWQTLISRQRKCVAQYACEEYQHALAQLDLPNEQIPQCKAISEKLYDATAWKVAPVDALISFEEFYHMLANKVFPAASFIRSRQELDYLQEPDIFHEIFGHTPLLMNQRFAEFSHAIGKIGLAAEPADYSWLARLYWFTIEFGLIHSAAGPRPYGAGIVSSFTELPYSIESNAPKRLPFKLMDVLRTPYRIDALQTSYFIIDDFEELFELIEQDLQGAIREARRLGMYEANFPLACTKHAA